MRRIVLLMTSGCSLCDDALDLILASKALAGFPLELVDIAMDDGLLEAYATKIPVIRFNDVDIPWPFDEKDFLKLSANFSVA